MSLASDSNDEFDFPEFTEQDFADIDAIVHKHLNWPSSSNTGDVPSKSSPEQPTSSSHIVISIEKDPMLAQANLPKYRSYAQLSPFESYRSQRNFTVTDLAGPAWCELQFDYGLRQQRHRKLEDRPPSFVSAQGKTINVSTKTALQREKTVEAGRVVHKKLELEIRPEQIEVSVTTKEERWGLRLINMMVCVEDLLSSGFCREMPVFGVIHDHIVTGIIDEISWTRIPEHLLTEKVNKRHITSTPSTPQKPKRRRLSTSSPDMHAMTTLFDRIPLQSTADSSFPKPVTHRLKLLDNKTRRSRTLPSDRDTLPSKIQLMLYHRLLTGLVSVSPDPQALDLRDFWSRVQVNPALTFSSQFCEESGLSIESTKVTTGQAKTWSLNDLVQLWMALVSSLEIEGVDSTLTLSYRSREFKGVKNQKRKTAVQSTLEDIMMAQAINSLQETGITDEALFARLVAESIGNGGIGTPEPSKVDPEDTESTASEEEAQPHDNIIGFKSFPYDEPLLTGHLTRVFEWWHGLRPPQGVDIEDSGRCRTCEYRDDCEWRLSKAAEALDKVRSPVPGSKLK